MAKILRFVIGFLLGLILTGIGLVLSRIGHGTYAPMICNVGVLGFIFLPFILFLAPFQWGLYLLLIPEVTSSKWRTFWVVAVILFHLVPGWWMASTDPAFARAMNQDTGSLLLYSVLLLVTVAVFVFVGLRGTNRNRN